MSVAVEWDGLTEAQSVLQSMLIRGEDMTPLMQDIAAYGVSSTQSRIADEKRSPDGQKWVPYKDPKYAERKRKHSSGGMLEYSSMLIKSMTSNAGHDFSEWGSNREYAARQHFGGDGVESRKYLGINKKNSSVIEDFIKKYYDD